MESNFIQVRDGASIAVHRFIPTTPIARIIILHAASVSSDAYFGLSRLLMSYQYEVICVDYRGHGDSEGEPGMLNYVGQLEDDVHDILQEVNEGYLGLPTVLLGHSYGVFVCLRYLQRYGQRAVQGLCFLAPSLSLTAYARRYPDVLRCPSPMQTPLYSLTEWAIRVSEHVPWLGKRPVLRFFEGAGVPPEKQKVLCYSYHFLRNGDLYNIVQGFADLEIPTLMLCAENDELVGPCFYYTIHHWYMPFSLDRTTLTVPSCTHYSIITDAAQYVATWLEARFAPTCVEEEFV